MTVTQHAPVDIPHGDVITTANDNWDLLTRTTSSPTITADNIEVPSIELASYAVNPVTGEICDLREFLELGTTKAGAVIYFYVPSAPTAVVTFWQLRTSTVGAFSGRDMVNLQLTTPPATTVAAGSNGVNTSTFAGAGVLNCGSSTGFNAGTDVGSPGTITVATAGTPAVISYTGKTTTTFTGCTTLSGGGVLATGGAINQDPALRIQLQGANYYVSQPYAMAQWNRLEIQVEMGTTTTDGIVRFAHYEDDTDAAALVGIEKIATNVDTGLISERVEYTSEAFGRCSPAVSDVTSGFRFIGQVRQGVHIGTLGNVWETLVVDPPPEEEEPPIIPEQFTRVRSFVSDGDNWV